MTKFGNAVDGVVEVPTVLRVSCGLVGSTTAQADAPKPMLPPPRNVLSLMATSNAVAVALATRIRALVRSVVRGGTVVSRLSEHAPARAHAARTSVVAIFLIMIS